MRTILAAAVLAAVAATASAQPFYEITRKEAHLVEGSEHTILNLRHVHGLEKCSATDEPVDRYYACFRTDANGWRGGLQSDRLWEVEVARFTAFVGALGPPAPEPPPPPLPPTPDPNTAPTVTITGPTVATSGSAVTFTALVVDADAADVHTYAWAESDATSVGGTFAPADAATVTWTPTGTGSAILVVTVTDLAGETATANVTVVVS